MAMRKPVVRVARAGSAGWLRAALSPQPVSRYEPPLTIAPAVGRAVGDPLPDVAGELLGAERRRAVRVRGDRHGPAHERPRRSCSRSRRTCRPTDRRGRRRRARAPPTRRRSGGGRRTDAQNASASARVTSVAGWSASWGSCALGRGGREVRVDDRVAADQHAPQLDLALLARLAERVAAGGQLDERIERWTIASYDRDRRIIARERPGGKRLQAPSPRSTRGSTRRTRSRGRPRAGCRSCAGRASSRCGSPRRSPSRRPGARLNGLSTSSESGRTPRSRISKRSSSSIAIWRMRGSWAKRTISSAVTWRGLTVTSTPPRA